MSPLPALLSREIRLAVRAGGGAFVGVLFFLVLVSLMPFALGPDMGLLARIGPAILWIGALLSTLLGLERLFQTDREDGTLDLLVTGRTPLELVVAVKALAHWLTSGLPLVAAAPLLGLMVGLDPDTIGLTTLTLLIGTPALTLIGAIGAALVAGLRRGGLLLAVIVLPLSVPVLIFGVGATAATAGPAGTASQPLLILTGLVLGLAVLAPVAGAAALRAGLSD